MRQDFFTFSPAFKLKIGGNHKPELRGVDEAIRRRLNRIPFIVTIPEGGRDLLLPDKLRAEWPAILAWAIEGCLEWQRIGLALPRSRAASDRSLSRLGRRAIPVA
jgi:putative DNA primase/helicase